MANEPLDEFDRRLKAKKEYANYGFIADIDSGLSPAETLGYYDLQKMSDDEYNKFSQAVKSNNSPTIDTSSIINDDKPGIGTAVMNGLKGSVRGLFGAAKAAVDANIEAHKGDKNVVKEYDQSKNISKALGYVTDEILKREEVRADTAAGQLGYDLAENGVQLLVQLALTKGVGAAGAGAKTVHAISMLYNGANISGEQYLRLRKEGVSASRAGEAGLLNAIPQAVLEELPLGKLLKKMPAGSGLKAKIWEVTKRGLEEGVTEALQEFPEQATDLWAKNPGASAAKLAEKWGENWQQNLKEAGYSGLIGAILGGTASGAKVAVDSVVEHVALKANEERKAKLVADAERIRETGINPERAAATIEANNPNFEDDTVTVSAQDLEGYKQTSSNNKLYEELGITEDEVATAAELGQDIDISRGKFTATMAKDNALFEATKDNMYFDSNGELSDGGAKTRKELREGYNLTRQASAELDTELDAIVDSATKAGMNKSHAGNLRLVLESRALVADPENPAAWLQKNKLRFENGGKVRQKNGWFSKGGELNKEQFYTTNITGNEMGHYTDLKDLQKKTFAWYRDNLQGTSVYNSVLGEIRIDKGYQENNIKFTGAGKREMSHTAAKREKLFATRYLREIIENGNFVTEAASQKEKHSGEHFYYIHSTLNVNGQKMYVVVNVIERKDKSLSYYNHNVFNENEYKKIEDALKPSGSGVSSPVQHLEQQSSKEAFKPSDSEQFKAQPSILNETSSFADSVSQKADNYKQQKIVNGTLKDKGMISPMDDGTYVITLFKGADASTVIHETGHYFVETLINEALADPSNARLNADAKKLMEYAGIDADTWASGDVEAKRAGHEKLAEAFETYIMEGKAPSVGLRGAFQRFANWLSVIYSKIARSENAAELTPEVRQVFDRMLACREEIEVMARMEGMFGALPDNITSTLSEQNKKALQDKILKAKDKAVDILTRRAMADFSAKRRAEKAAFVEEIRPQIEEAVARELVNRARVQVGQEFGQESKLANPAIIARKYRHVLGNVLPNYNDMLNDTNASIDDILNPIVEYLQAEVDTYGALSKERVANAEDMLVAAFSKARQKTVVNPSFVVDANGMAHANFKQKINEWETIEANPRRLARKYIYGNERINYNELLKDTNGAIDDILNPIADRIESELAEYQDTVKSERAFFINGKWGYFAATNRTEGKYANDFAGIPDQSAVLVDFGEIGKDGKRHWTKRALEQADIEGLVFHEAGDSIRNVNWVSRYVHDYGGSVSDLTSKKGRRRIAEKIARGEDIADYYDLRSTGLDYGDAEIKADFKHIVEELDRLQALKHRLETDPEGVDLVKESKRNQLSQEQKELFDQIAEENGYAGGYEMAREIVEGYTVNENEGSDVQDNWARNYIRNGGDRAKLKSEEGLKEIAETLVEGEQLAELNELKALKHELETNPDKVDLVEMSKKRALSNEQRELFDWVADSLGYDSGDAMAQDILTSPSERAMVRQEIDKAVNRRFPDFMQEREQAREAAREALYNDESGEVVALEQQLIDEALNEISDKDIKQKERENIAKVRKQNADNFAKRYIQTLPAGEVMKPRRFAMAERRAAANANKAAKAGLLEEAAMYKQQQMINHALYREAVKAKHQIESARKYVRKQMHSKKEVWGTEQHFFQMCALLERMGYHRKDFNTNGREVQPLSDYIAEMQAKYGGEIISMPDFVLNPNNDLTNAPQLSLANYMDVIDALKNIRAIAKQDTQMNKIAAGEAFEQVKADTIAHLQELPVEYEAEIGSDSKKSLRKRILDWPKNIIATLRNADNFFLMMDNWAENGYFTREFYNKINHCADMESEMLEGYQNELTDALQKWEPDKKTGIAHEQRIYYKELGGSADKHALIAMLCNLGSDSNAARLCSQKPVGVKNSDIWVEESELIGREEAMLQTKQNLIEFLCKHLTKEDIAYAQARINAASKFWPMLAEVNRRTKGFEPPKIEASPLVMKLASGESVVFDGGYFPLERDMRTGSMPGKFDRIDSTEEGSRPPQRTLATNTGSSKARIGGKYPVDLSRGSEVTAVKSTIHDICYRETMLDFRKILNDEDIYRNMVERLGDTNVRLFREFLQACANPYGNKTAYMAEKTFTKIADALRNAATNMVIMFNFKAAMQNATNIFIYGNSVAGFTHADVFRALYRGFTGEGRAEVDAICAKSAFMRERSQAPDITLRDIQKRSDLDPIEKKTLKYGALLLGYTDMMTAKPVFAEAYMKKINEGKTEQEALDFANTVIRRTLGSSRIHDVSSLQRSSGLFRVFTMFQGFFNTQFNQWDREAHIVKRLWNSGEKKEMVERLIAFVGAKFLSVCFLNVAIAELSLTAPFEKDEDGYRKLTKELINYPLSMGGPVVQAANVGVQTLLGMRNYGYRLTAVQGLMDKGFTVIRRAGKVARGEEGLGELAEQAAYVFGAWRGVPAGIVNILFNSLDIAEDNMDFELQDLIKRRPRSERKHEQ
nr:MAG TPA: crystallin beta/gamma motif-containing protein [Bacteriophage sp.]